jgi:hypothetical protein
MSIKVTNEQDQKIGIKNDAPSIKTEVDKTLSVAGAAADAKVVGEKFKELENNSGGIKWYKHSFWMSRYMEDDNYFGSMSMEFISYSSDKLIFVLDQSGELLVKNPETIITPPIIHEDGSGSTKLELVFFGPKECYYQYRFMDTSLKNEWNEKVTPFKN